MQTIKVIFIKKIILSSYPIDVNGEEIQYDVKKSIMYILYDQQLKLSAKELLDNDRVAQKVINCKDDSILLENAEYEQIKYAFSVFRGFGLNDVELVKRIMNAPDVEVKEA